MREKSPLHRVAGKPNIPVVRVRFRRHHASRFEFVLLGNILLVIRGEITALKVARRDFSLFSVLLVNKNTRNTACGCLAEIDRILPGRLGATRIP